MAFINPSDIQTTVVDVGLFLKENRIDPSLSKKIRKKVSNVLNQYLKNGYADKEFSYDCYVRFGQVVVKIRVPGLPLDPLKNDEDVIAFSHVAGLDRPYWNYIDNENQINIAYKVVRDTTENRLFISKSGEKREKTWLGKLLEKEWLVYIIIILFSIGIGFAVRAYLPDPFKPFLLKLLELICSKYMSILRGTAAFVVFFGLIKSICTCFSSFDDLKKDGLRMIKNLSASLVLITLVFFGISFVASQFVLNPMLNNESEVRKEATAQGKNSTTSPKAADQDKDPTSNEEDPYIRIGEMIVDIVPDSIVAPFVESRNFRVNGFEKDVNDEPIQIGTGILSVNILQIVTIAFVIGIILVMLKDKNSATIYIINSFNRMNDLFTTVVNLILSGMKPYVALSMILLANETLDTTDLVISIFAILGLGIFILISWGIIVLLPPNKEGISKLRVLKEGSIAGGKCFFHASSIAAINPATTGDDGKERGGEAVNGCTNLKVSPNRIDLYLKPGSVIYMPAVMAFLMITTVLFSFRAGKPVDIPTLIAITISSFLLAIAMPPVPGGTATGYSLIFSQFHLDCYPIVLGLDKILADRLMTVGNIGALVMEAARLDAITEKQSNK